MAWSITDLSSKYQSRLAADKSMLIASMIPTHPDYAKWVEEAVFTIGGDITTWSDRSASGYPARKAYDGFPDLVTKPSISPTDDCFALHFDLGELVQFDSAFITGHNLGTIGSITALELQIADDNGFATSLTTVADLTDFGGAPTDDNRLRVLSLSHDADAGRAHDTAADAGPNVYSAQYVRLYIKKTGTNIIPEIGELILGSRTQLAYRPNRPFDDYSLSEDSEIVVTRGGVVHKALNSRRAFILAGEFDVDDDDDADDLAQWFRDTTGPFVWIGSPGTSPEKWHMMIRHGGFELPSVDANMRSFKIAATEQGPEGSYLDTEVYA